MSVGGPCMLQYLLLPSLGGEVDSRLSLAT